MRNIYEFCSVCRLAVMVYSGQELKLFVNFDPSQKSNSRNPFPFMGIPKVSTNLLFLL